MASSNADPLENLVTEEEENQGEDPNLEILEMQRLELWKSREESGHTD
jgi:hypothetical protein